MSELVSMPVTPEQAREACDRIEQLLHVAIQGWRQAFLDFEIAKTTNVHIVLGDIEGADVPVPVYPIWEATTKQRFAVERMRDALTIARERLAGLVGEDPEPVAVPTASELAAQVHLLLNDDTTHRA